MGAWHDLCHEEWMSEKTARARLDDESRLALRMLVRSGMTESEAVRTAVDVTRVGKRLSRIDADEAVEIDRSVRLVLGLR